MRRDAVAVHVCKCNDWIARVGIEALHMHGYKLSYMYPSGKARIVYMWHSMHGASPYHMCAQDKDEDYATPVAGSSGTQLASDGLVCSENQKYCLPVDCLINWQP